LLTSHSQWSWEIIVCSVSNLESPFTTVIFQDEANGRGKDAEGSGTDDGKEYEPGVAAK